MSDICFMTAAELAARVRRRELSAMEIMRAHLNRIERVNPSVNAIVTLLPDRAIKGAEAIDKAISQGIDPGPLAGLPIAHKDLIVTKGIRTTFGSPIYRDYIPAQDAVIIERLRAAGAVSIGKTNTPEFGAGSQTFNEVFGETLNPYDVTRTCGGSSGGAAVALATGMLPIADGSDMGGSLRNPAAFCNVVGMRPSPGRVPVWPEFLGWWWLSVEGPMARTVGDCAMLLSAIAGPDSRSPISLDEHGSVFARPLGRDFRNVRIAWSRTLGGLPVEPAIAAALESQRRIFESLGCIVEDVDPDFRETDEVFKTLRAWRFATTHGGLLSTHRHVMKDTVVWNIEEGLRLSAVDVGRAEMTRTRLYHRLREFMSKYAFLVCPVTQVAPFDVKRRWVERINETPMETYIDWMKSCYYISAAGLPAISVPAGFTPGGLPVGIQIVGGPRDDFGTLQLAYAFEQETQFYKRQPGVGRSDSGPADRGNR